jgi:hypothetical protein
MLQNLLALLIPIAPGIPHQAVAPHGSYIEARTASVFAGACHYGAQYTTQGREALVGWRFEGGAFEGVDLAGVSLVCVLAGDRNLAEEDVRVSSVVLLDARASAAARAASLRWLQATQAGWLGEVREVRTAELEVSAAGERYELSAGESLRLRGALLTERECCKMPYDVWYRPLASVQGAIVGCSEELLLGEPLLERRSVSSGENDAFVARFGAPAPCAPERQAR